MLSLIYKIKVLLSGGLAMFDVYSDYFVLSSLYYQSSLYQNDVDATQDKAGFFKLSFAVIVFAAVAVALQIWRMGGRHSSAMRFVISVMSLIQAHWIFLFFVVFFGADEKAKSMHEWYESTVLTEVVLESIPQLLLQSYIILTSLRSNGSNISDFTAQLVSIGFSIAMISKTILQKTMEYKGQFRGPDQQQKGDESHNQLTFVTRFYIALFVFFSLLARCFMIVVAAIGLTYYFFLFMGIAFALRFLKEFIPGFLFNPAQALIPTKFLQTVQGAVARIFREYWNDTGLLVISTLEIAFIVYFVLIDESGLVTTEKPLGFRFFYPALIATTLLRTLMVWLLRRRVRRNKALIIKDETGKTIA